jgi:hypothetical protein
MSVRGVCQNENVLRPRSRRGRSDLVFADDGP